MFSDNLNKLIIKSLKENHELRNDFMKLLAIVWRNEIEESDHTLSSFVFLSKIYNRQVTHPESIRRTWQQIQKENPDLRGTDWEKRQKHSNNGFKIALKENKEIIKPQEKFEFD